MWHDQGKWVTCRKCPIPVFLGHFLITPKCFILIQTLLQLDIWLQSYEELVNAKNNIKQRNLTTVFANISKSISPTSDSCLLIVSHMLTEQTRWFLMKKNKVTKKQKSLSFWWFTINNYPICKVNIYCSKKVYETEYFRPVQNIIIIRKAWDWFWSI